MVILFCALFLVFTKHIIHAAYILALLLLSTSAVYVFLYAELLAVVQILLYAGGVVILLLFGIMMSNRVRGNKVISESKNTLPAAIISMAIFMVLSSLFSTIEAPSPVSFEENQVEAIGISLFTDHLVAFELIAFVLLVALVGAAYLAKISSDE